MAKNQDDEPMEGSMPVNDAWTGLLAISLIALMVATGFLAWDWMQYGDEETIAKMKITKLTGTLPKKGEGEVKKPIEKKVEEKKVEEKKDEAKKDEAKKDASLRLKAIPQFNRSPLASAAYVICPIASRSTKANGSTLL